MCFSSKIPNNQVRDALLEVVRVAQAQGINLKEEAAEDVYRYFQLLASKTPNATSSMQRDIINGVPSEVCSLSCACCNLGCMHLVVLAQRSHCKERQRAGCPYSRSQLHLCHTSAPGEEGKKGTAV